MNELALAFTLIAAALVFALPRRLAVLPLLCAVLYFTRGQTLELESANLTVLHLVIGAGLLRMLLRGERPTNFGRLDVLVLAWGACLLATSLFHTKDTWLFRAGTVYTEVGGYLLLRTLVRDADDVRFVFAAVGVLLVPCAALMVDEKLEGVNPFGFLGGVNEYAVRREGGLRATGPFAHPILAGTVGATALGMSVYTFHRHRLSGAVGVLAGAAVLFASASSGPVIMAMTLLLAMFLWRWRAGLRGLRWLVLLAIIALDRVMQDPVYFLMARIDITGGSQGWYRARLIQSALSRLDEWWLYGTDYTRHWMPSGIPANDQHVDITNHFLQQGVTGGLPLMLLMVAIVATAFGAAGRSWRAHDGRDRELAFLAWTTGALLFGHVLNFLSISLFDYSVVFFHLVLASIAALPQEQPAARTAPAARAPRPAAARPANVRTAPVRGATLRGVEGRSTDLRGPRPVLPFERKPRWTR